MNANFKNFSDIKVGDKLYWSAPDMDHISSTLVTDIHLELDGEHLPKCCDVIFTTVDSFEFNINNLILNRHNLVIFDHKINGNTIYIGTTKMAVANNIIKFLDNKIAFWASRKERLINHLVEED
jgi:hypothetical protein